jgi:hypothetical protein
MRDLNSVEANNTNPNIMLPGTSGQRYANPFFDLSQQYMPPTIKELFRWCTFYYYNSPLIGSTITKLSRYPITDLIIEDEHESVRQLWIKIFNQELKLKDRYLEINLDYHVYGNAFVSLSFPFTRFLICKNCKTRYNTDGNPTDWSFNSSSYNFQLKCSNCGHTGECDVNDVPFKDRKKVKLVRWNPENIHIKYNEYTGNAIYMYSIPYKLKNAIQRGDKDIIGDTPMIVLDAVKQRRMIRLNGENFRHMKRPTLAEQDQGWGKPLIIHVLKDMYYLYTLRRAQEAIALEHIVPFDIIYPMPNAQQDPYIHTDLANWRTQIETIIKKHRKDPNFKGVIPIPVGFGRMGGDGKAMMLTPELNYLTQTIVGGMGIPQEFLFGGLNWTGSSISLRTLENDFIQNRSQMLDLTLWIKDKLRVYCALPELKSVRFADFRMADDIQRNQQLIGLNAQMKVSDQTLLTELGYDYDQEVKKMMEEVYISNYMNELRTKGQAKVQGEAQIIGWNYQNKLNDLVQKAQEAAQKKMVAQEKTVVNQEPITPENQSESGLGDPALAPQDMDPAQAMQNPMGQQLIPQNDGVDINRRVGIWVGKLNRMDPQEAQLAIAEIRSKMPELGDMIASAYNSSRTAGGGKSSNNAKSVQPNMNPLPEKGAPTRAGVA